MAKDLIKDGASTIYSPTWLAQNSQGSTGGSGVSTRADVLDPNCGSDLSDGCMGGGGGSPYPGEGGCDPSTDPYGCEPPPPPPPPACPDPTNPLCGPDCATDPTNPDCNSCPDPTNPACNTGACPDGTNPPCGPPPPTCPDPNNPNCGSQGNCVVLVPCPPGGNSGPDPCNLILNPAQTGCPSPIPVPVQQADIKGCIYGSGGGAIPVYSNPHLWPAIGVACLAVGTAYSIVAGLGIK